MYMEGEREREREGGRHILYRSKQTDIYLATLISGSGSGYRPNTSQKPINGYKPDGTGRAHQLYPMHERAFFPL